MEKNTEKQQDGEEKQKVGMTLAAYARHQKVRPCTVTKWKQAGYLTFFSNGLVDVVLSDERMKAAGRGNNPDPKKTNELKDTFLKLLRNDNLLSEAEARKAKENYAALLRKLEYEEKTGKLIEAEPLKKALFEIWRRERDSLLRLPSRIGAVLAAKFGIDQNEMVIELEKVITEYLADRSAEPFRDVLKKS